MPNANFFSDAHALNKDNFATILSKAIKIKEFGLIAYSNWSRFAIYAVLI